MRHLQQNSFVTIKQCNIKISITGIHHGCFSRFLNGTNGTKSRNALLENILQSLCSFLNFRYRVSFKWVLLNLPTSDPPTTDQPTTNHLLTDQPIHRPPTHRPADPILPTDNILFKRLGNSGKNFVLRSIIYLMNKIWFCKFERLQKNKNFL